jgi:hypothetical protein
MKDTLKSIGFAAIIAAITFAALSLAGCSNGTSDSGGGGLKTLTGTITISPSDNVTAGTELAANYSGSETVTYQWNKDGGAITGATGGKHTPAETGSYTVTVSAAGYNPKTSAAVTVTGQPLADLPGNVTISPSTGVTTGTVLTASYSGTEMVSFLWNKDGALIPGASGNKYTPAEAGSYTVTASAAGYKSKTSAAVAVTGASLPDLAGNVSISPSSGVTTGTELTASYSGTEAVSWQWNKDGAAIPGASGNKYTPAEAGSYTVTAGAEGYKSKTSAAVAVTQAPLADLPGAVTISPSSGVTTGTALTASYSGTVAVSWQWNKGGSAITGAVQSTYTPAEEGSYTVTASAAGYNPKTSAAVAVTGAPLPDLPGNVTISPSSGVTVGMPLTAAYSGTVAVSWQWNKDGAAIPGTSGNQYTPAEAGSYTVTASAAGYKSKTSAAVAVTGAPLPDLAGNVTISPNTDVRTGTELTAYYSGDETITYQWNRNDSAITGAAQFKYTPSQTGSYTVTVSAAGYKSKTSAVVTVTLPDLTGTVTISPNTDVKTHMELTASYSGTEAVTYQWKRGDTNAGTNSSKYTPLEAGNYTVTVSATGYNSKTSAAVTVTIADLAGNITISPSGDSGIGTELTANYSGSETITYQWKRGAANVGTNSSKYTPTQAGSYTVTVSATGYNSKASGAVTITAETGVPGADLAAKLAWLKSNAQSNTSYIITVDKDESLDGITYYGAQRDDINYIGYYYADSYDEKTNITIRLTGGQSVSLSSGTDNLFLIMRGVTLILDQITLNGGVQARGGALEMKTGAKFGGSNYVSLYGGTFTMSGGKIGSSVSVGNGTFMMSGGEIGSVSVGNGTFTMNGGKISNSKGDRGVLVGSDGSFTMNNGEISGNIPDDTFGSSQITYRRGGGVFIAGGTFTMNGGKITGNTAAFEAGFANYDFYSQGGGVYVDSGTFTMNDGEITGNTASVSDPNRKALNRDLYSQGGGVFMRTGTFTMKGGKISGNTASSETSYNNYLYSYGGGVFIAGGTFTMSGGEISGNTASGIPYNTSYSSYAYGGGVSIAGGTFTMSGGEITGNTASTAGNSSTSYSRGGGVNVDGGTFTKSGGTITGYDTVNGNVVKKGGVVQANMGHAAYVSSGSKRRETTAGPEVALNSGTAGTAGGWEN